MKATVVLILTTILAVVPVAASADDPKPCADAYCVHMRVKAPHPRNPRSPQVAQNAVLVPVFYPRANIGACGAAATVDPLACKAPPAPAVPQVTAGRVLQAFQRIPLPHLRSQTQPRSRTLVNFDTIFFVDAHQFRRTVTLLGRRVTLDITPTTFTWRHGDGTASVTGSPGAPYPRKDVVYRYQDAHRTFAHSVTIVWTARYRVGGGPWRPVPGSVTTTGPATDLRIAEGTPVLSGRR